MFLRFFVTWLSVVILRFNVSMFVACLCFRVCFRVSFFAFFIVSAVCMFLCFDSSVFLPLVFRFLLCFRVSCLCFVVFLRFRDAMGMFLFVFLCFRVCVCV